MSRIWIARRPQRKGLLVPTAGTKVDPSLLFPLQGLETSELDELVRALLEKQGRTGDLDKLIEQGELDYERRIKVGEARRELRRLMSLREEGAKLMQRGFRKWKTAYYQGGK